MLLLENAMCNRIVWQKTLVWRRWLSNKIPWKLQRKKMIYFIYIPRHSNGAHVSAMTDESSITLFTTNIILMMLLDPMNVTRAGCLVFLSNSKKCVVAYIKRCLPLTPLRAFRQGRSRLQWKPEKKVNRRSGENVRPLKDNSPHTFSALCRTKFDQDKYESNNWNYSIMRASRRFNSDWKWWSRWHVAFVNIFLSFESFVLCSKQVKISEKCSGIF